MTEKKTGVEGLFQIEGLCASVGGKAILNGVNLTVRSGETHALMGPNGSGKSTLAHVLMGHPDYEVTAGEIRFAGRNLVDLAPEERARLRLFLAFQYPVAVPGVTVARFLKTACDAVHGRDALKASAFLRRLREEARFLDIDEAFINRPLNEGFSGGEKKRMEILQMLMLQPRMVVLDETDSGLDIDALKIVSGGVNRLVGPDLGLLVITHYERILRYIRPDHLHIMMEGRIVRSGGPELVESLEEKGYDWIREGLAENAAAAEAAP